jgi:hypothetical protein
MILMPLGVGPDDNHHITQIYCAYGEREKLCFDNEDTPGVWDKATGPKKINQLGTCFRHNFAQSAQCSDISDAPEDSHFKVSSSEFDPQKGFQNLWIGKHFGEKYLTLVVYKISLKCEESCSFIFSASDENNKFLIFQQGSIESNKKADLVLSILPSLNGGNLEFYNYDKLVQIFKLRDFGGSYSQSWNNSFGEVISNQEFKSKLEPNSLEFDSITTAYEYQPNIVYKLQGWLADTNVTSSAWNMRFFSLLLVTIILIISSFILTKSTFLTTLSVLALTGIPMGISLFGTNNPSLYAWIYAVIFTSLSYEILMKGYKKNRFLSNIFIVVVFILSAARNDAIIFNICILIFLFIIKFKSIHKINFTCILIFALSVNYYFSQNTVSLGAHANLNWLRTIRFTPFHILTEFPSVLAGNFGDRGPLNVWGLSWYDVPMPSIVSVITLSIIIFVWVIYLNNCNLYETFFLTLGMCTVFLFLIISLLSTSENPPGGFIQSRYILPYFSSIYLLTTLVSLDLNKDKGTFRLSAQLKYLISALIFTSSFIAIIIAVTRFGNGIAVVEEPWLEFFQTRQSYSWVGHNRLLFQVPHLETLFTPIVSSSYLVIFLCFIQALSTSYVVSVGLLNYQQRTRNSDL